MRIKAWQGEQRFGPGAKIVLGSPAHRGVYPLVERGQ